MNKSKLRQLVKEAIGYSKYAPGGTTKGGTTDDFRNILTEIVNDRPEEEDKLYSKQEAIEYIESNQPVKYYKIGVSRSTSQQATSVDDAINIVTQSPISQFRLARYGDVIHFSAPLDQESAY